VRTSANTASWIILELMNTALRKLVAHKYHPSP
jgi:hypothetical protein